MATVIGTRIKSLRKKSGLTQIQLASKLNIADSTLSQYESGQRVPSDDLKIEIANFYNVSLDYLLGRTDDPRPLEPDERYSAIIGERLRSVRESRNLSVSDVAKASNISESEILAVEDGASVNFVKTLEKMARYYNVSANYFLGLFDDPTPVRNMRKTSNWSDVVREEPVTDYWELMDKWNFFLRQLPEDQAMLYQNTDYPDEEKIAIMEEAEKAKKKKLKKIKRFEEFTDDIIDEAYRFAKYQDEQRKKMDDEN